MATDYSKAENWDHNEYDDPQKADTNADVFFFYGTARNKGDHENGVADINEEMRTNMSNMYPCTMAFNDGVRMYIPFFRQIGVTEALINGAKDGHNALINMMKNSEVLEDICASLDYYFENYNEGRPFIIAGASQGGAAVQIALECYFGKEENRKYLDLMVAAYSIAYGVDKNWIESLDYLKYATGADDTGVVISWVTEGPGEKDGSMLLADIGKDTLNINPINWKTDETYASGEECPGSLVDGQLVTPGQYNMQIDLERGSVICDNNTDYVKLQMNGKTIWGGKSLHMHEFNMAFLSIRENMHNRINAFLAKEGC